MSAFAAVPQLINAQGKLTDAQGQPLSDDNYSITFTIYDAPTGGNIKWTETNPLVNVVDGQFNVLLGSISPIHDSVFAGEERYLAMKIGNDPEMIPRSRLVSVGYAQRVQTLSGATAGTITGQLDVIGGLQVVPPAGTDAAIFRVRDGNLRLQNQNPRLYFSDNLGTGYIGTDNNKTFLFAPDEQVKVKLNTNQMALNNCNLAVQNFNPRIFLLDLAGTGFIGTDNNMNFVFAPGQTERLRLSTDGHMTVYGTTTTNVLEITGGSDLAEPFEISENNSLNPGDVLIIDETNTGKLKLGNVPYDSRVAGIVSGAGGIQAGLTLRQEGVMEGTHNVALSGRVYVRASACNGSIKPGDLLTTSSIPGCAMKVTDRQLAPGATIGKAMSALEAGEGLVLVLVNLQ